MNLRHLRVFLRGRDGVWLFRADQFAELERAARHSDEWVHLVDLGGETMPVRVSEVVGYYVWDLESSIPEWDVVKRVNQLHREHDPDDDPEPWQRSA